MKKSEIVHKILGARKNKLPQHAVAKASAPSNIALCKYWGKRDQELNLPVTSSLSLSLGDKGAVTELSISMNPHDEIYLNGTLIAEASSFSQRLCAFFDLFRMKHDLYFTAHITTNIPVGAGLASSACGFAAMTQALNLLFGWELAEHELSILARLGSGSASRSIWHGFVEWHAGTKLDGMDSYASPLPEQWPELCIGLLVFNEAEKEISSRDAMQCTVATSPLYAAWATKVSHDLSALKQAIHDKDFSTLGETAESNALTMHATMLSAWPPICYAMPETIVAMKKIWQLRQQGLMLFFTQDAGPNLKLIFLAQDQQAIQSHFPGVAIVRPFAKEYTLV